MNAIVDRVDARGGVARLVVRSEGEGEHRLEGAPETAHVTMGLTQKRAVLRDALRHERMGELQEDRPAPAREERHLAMEPPAHRVRARQRRSIHGTFRPRATASRRSGPAPVLARERVADDRHAEGVAVGFVRHAEPLHHAARGPVLGPGHRHDALETDRPEPVIEGRPSGLGREASAP